MDFLLQIAHLLIAISSWLTNHKEIVGLVLAASGGVSLTLEPVKRWLQLQSKLTISIYHYLFALIPVGVHYIQGSHSTNPLIIFAQAFIILGTNQFVYPMFTKPLTGIFLDAKAQANIRKLEQTAKSAGSDYAG
jgi:hypothetical protein